jgi:hypothetical protein
MTLRRPSDVRSARAALGTAAGVFAAERQAHDALAGGLAVLAERARQGVRLQGWSYGVTRARDMFRAVERAERQLTDLQRQELRRLRAEWRD